jgi:hypothetical protein
VSAWTAGTPLIATLDELSKFLGPHAFANVQRAAGDYDLMDLVERSSDELRASIKGVDPSEITNADDYKPALAAHVHAELLRLGFMRPPDGVQIPVSPFDWSKPRMAEVEPVLSGSERPASIGSSLPKVRNVNDSYFS